MGSQSGHRPLSFPPPSGIRHMPRRTRGVVRRGVSRSLRPRAHTPASNPPQSAKASVASFGFACVSLIQFRHRPQRFSPRTFGITPAPLRNRSIAHRVSVAAVRPSSAHPASKQSLGTLYYTLLYDQYLVFIRPTPLRTQKSPLRNTLRVMHIMRLYYNGRSRPVGFAVVNDRLHAALPTVRAVRRPSGTAQRRRSDKKERGRQAEKALPCSRCIRSRCTRPFLARRRCRHTAASAAGGLAPQQGAFFILFRPTVVSKKPRAPADNRQAARVSGKRSANGYLPAYAMAV